jgi:serine/threonine protein kinase/tetratricopeptide (TPR) repeat protein
MPQNRLRQIEEIFQSALALAPEERSKFVRDRTPDPEIRREIEKLLSDNKSAAAAEENNYEPNINEPTGLTGEEFLDLPTDKQTDSDLPRDDNAATDKAEQSATVVDRLIGQRVGVFELKKEIGRGGMGAVYLAERADGEFRQKVAVKLIKRGMDTDFIVRRFRHERQILANLNHPNIANLLDGGTSADGLPYFVMEFIEGELLYNYCDKNRLDTRQRLQIFKQVCSAVQAAHEHQIIHRDIKPGNILVTATGVPKLLDFGIAKILDPDLIHESVHPTSTMMRLMTLDYASPEQICGGEITPASDVYALGVLLYELLTGHNPYNFINGRSPHEVSRVICEVRPELPSRIVASDEALLPLYTSNNITTEKSAEFRGNTIDALQLELTDNLDRILMKALSKSPEERFASVKEFVADITRHLNGQTVLAETRLLTNSFSRTDITERTTVSNKSIAVLPFKLLNVATGDETGDKFLGIGLADALITRLSNVQRFVVRPTSSVLRYGEKHLDPFATARELDVEFVLEGHIQKVGKRIRVSVQLLNVAEQTTIWAERFDENYTDVLHLEDVISVRAAEALIPQLTSDEREVLAKRGTDNPKAFESYLRGRFHWNTFTEDGFAKAIVAYHEAIAHDPDYAVAYAGIADYYNWLAVFGILPAQECFQSAIEAATKAISLDRDLSEAHAALGFAVVGGHYDWAQGETACRRALKLNPNNSTAHVWYSIQLFMEGRFEEGIKHAKRAIEIDPLAPFNHHNLGWGLYFARRFEESIEQYRQLITITNSKYPLAFFGLCWGLRLTKNFDEAIEAIEKALELDPESAFMLTCYGQTLAAAGRRKEAEEVLAKLEKLAEQRFVSSYHIAIIYTFWGENEKALTALEKSFEDRGEAWLVWMGVEPVFDSLREDVRFMNLLERTKNPLFHGENTVVMEGRAETSANKIQTTDSDTQGFSKQTIVPPAASAARLPKWASVAAGLIILLLAGALFFAVRSNQKTNTPPNEQQNNTTENKIGSQPRATANTLSIAVLPFATVNARTDDEQYLGVGTADLVTSKLSQIVEINLRSASSVRRYLKNDKSPVEAGRELAVDYVVSGTVERKENNVEVKLEMTEIASGRIVWSEIFDEPNGDLFALQDSISELIVKNLSLRLTNAEKQNLAKHFTENGEAQQLYVAGRFHFGKRTVEGLRQAISLFEKAIEMDPNFALAYTGIADCSALLNWYQEPQPPDAWAKAKEAAIKAVALDNDLAEAHASLAFIKFHYDRDYRGSEEEFRRAINLKPNYATAHQWYAFLLAAQARHNEAISMMRRAEELEPRSAVIANAVANVLFLARQYDESIAQANRSLEIDPSSVGAHVILRWNYEKLGMADRAMAIYEKETIFAGDTPTSRAKRAHVLAAIGKKDEALRILNGLISNKQIEQITPYEIGVIYSLLDDKTKGFEWLKKAKDVHAVGFSFVKVDPLLDNLRTDPRFEALLQ